MRGFLICFFLAVNAAFGQSAPDTTGGKSFLKIYNVFTPNFDGVNDIFKPEAYNLQQVKGEIYSRWGELLYFWDLLSGGWDGYTFSGLSAPEGVYFYIFTADGIDGKKFKEKGAVTLIR